MCARRFLIVVLILTVIAVAASFAIYQWGGSVLLRQATPKGHFEAAAAGDAPDYSVASNWLARPGLADDPSHWLPEPLTRPTVQDVAVFYIHPTTYLATDRWNAPLRPAADTATRTRLFVQSQSSAFNGAGEIWAPRYRQAAYGAFLLKSEDAQRALDLAYSDVAAAFAAFVAQSGERPIVLAGHSQGGLHLEQLLAGRIAGKPVAKRIVAAYVVGWPISTTADLPALGLPACRSPAETGCILSWMSFGEPPNPKLILRQWEDTKGLRGADRRQADVLCVNPLTGTVDGSAPPSANPGTLVPTGDFKTALLEPGRVGARCENGLLIVAGDIPPLGPFALPGNNYHVFDYALFWGAVRRDAERRVAAWRR